MTVESPVRASTFSTRLECHFQKLGCALAGGDPKAIAKAALSEATVRECILKKITQQVDEECTCLCSRQPVSEFRKISPAQMENFTWDCLIEELKTKCPIFYRLLMTVVSHTDHRNTCKKGSVHNPGVCMAAAVLFKERNREMTGVQSYLSLVLYNSRVQKKVGLHRCVYTNITMFHIHGCKYACIHIQFHTHKLTQRLYVQIDRIHKIHM